MDTELASRIKDAAKILKSYGAREVYVFGSATTDTLRRHSDIDMAVVGLPAKVFFRAMGEASDVLGRSLDLVDLEKPSAFVRYLRESKDLRHVG